MYTQELFTEVACVYALMWMAAVCSKPCMMTVPLVMTVPPVPCSILLLSTQHIMKLISADMLGSRDGQGSVSFSHSVSGEGETQTMECKGEGWSDGKE